MRSIWFNYPGELRIMSDTNLTHAGELAIESKISLARLANSDLVIAIGLFLLGIASRLPFRSQILYHWDSVNFTFALQHFDLAKEQPQPPGYILYVWLARLVNAIYHDPQTSMVMISVVSSGLAIAALYLLGKAMFNRRAGAIAALFLAISPLFWFYGEIALPHTLDGFLTVLSAWLLYETMQGRRAALIPAILAMAVAGGVRQQTLVFLIPVALFALRRVGWKHFLLAMGVGAAATLTWFIPLISSAGGLSGYLHVVSTFSQRFQGTTSLLMGAGLSGLRHNLGKLVPYTLYACGFAIIPFLALAKRGVRQSWRRDWEKAIFLVLWVLPALSFYTIIQMGQQGLVFVFLPAFLIASAACIDIWLGEQRNLVVYSMATAMVLSAIFFLAAPEYPLGPSHTRILTRATLVDTDQYYASRFAAIQSNFNPASTVILAVNWHHLNYYLPQYRLLRFSAGQDGQIDEMTRQTITGDTFSGTAGQLGVQPGSDGKIDVVIFDPVLDTFDRTPGLVQQIALPGGGFLEYFALHPQDDFSLDGSSFGIVGR